VANGNLEAPAPANVRQLASQLISTVDAVLATLADRDTSSAVPDTASHHPRLTISLGAQG
jgi:hypothetical protein